MMLCVDCFVADVSPLQAHGKSLSDFVERHQDSSKNALRKSLEAAFAAWCEELRADQAQYCADKVMILVLFWVVFIGLWAPRLYMAINQLDPQSPDCYKDIAVMSLADNISINRCSISRFQACCVWVSVCQLWGRRKKARVLGTSWSSNWRTRFRDLSACKPALTKHSFCFPIVGHHFQEL